MYKAIVIGVSSGGMNAMKTIFALLPESFSIPIVIVQHLSVRSSSEWIRILNDSSGLHIKEADEKEKIESGHIYIAPPNYHLLVEMDHTFSLTIGERINFARPAIDILFETAAEAYRDSLIGVVLTGSNRDGTNGLQRIQECGGLTIVQDPATAESPYMPASVIEVIRPDYILDLEDIVQLFLKIDMENPIK